MKGSSYTMIIYFFLHDLLGTDVPKQITAGTDAWTKYECVLTVQECDGLCPILHATLHALWGVHRCVVARIPHLTPYGN
jgi:hypothetical protein